MPKDKEKQMKEQDDEKKKKTQDEEETEEEKKKKEGEPDKTALVGWIVAGAKKRDQIYS